MSDVWHRVYKARRFAAALVFLLTMTIHAENWPHWRGPAATGVSPEKGLPVQWSDTQNVAWKAKLRGVGISTPIVWGDRVFVTYQLGSGVSRPGPRLVQSGDPLAAGERPLGGVNRADPLTSVVFAITAFDRVTGKEIWTTEIKSEGKLPE